MLGEGAGRPNEADIKPHHCCIVILSYNAKGPLERLLQTIQSQDFARISTIVVDNGSTDGTTELLRHYDWVKVVQRRENGGAESANEGMKLALAWGADYVFLSDSDLVLEPDTISSLVSFMESVPVVGIAGPAIRGLYPRNGAPESRVNRLTAEVEPVRFVTDPSRTECVGAAMVTAEVIRKTGGYDPSFFMYYTDVDFCMRAEKEGAMVYIVPHILIGHEAAYSTKKIRGLRGFLSARNRAMLARKDFSRAERSRFLLHFPSLVVKSLGHWMREGQAVETLLCLIGSASGLFYLTRAEEPAIFRRVATALMGHRVVLRGGPKANSLAPSTTAPAHESTKPSGATPESLRNTLVPQVSVRSSSQT